MSTSHDPDPKFEALIHYIQHRRGFDFRGYKRTSLRRRIMLRMQEAGIEGFEAYQDFLEAHPQEFVSLLNTVLINVTSFFRDPEAWDVLRTQVVPRILERAGEHRPIRVWSVGCASGQEPYSVAMLLAEAVQSEPFCEWVKVYATDLDEGALAAARRAAYTARDVESVPPGLLEKYFERSNDHYVFQRDIRKCVIFGRHNIVLDAPISHIDLLLCRNLLIYLEAETQSVVLPRLHYALVNEGFLFLGKAETQLARSGLFQPVDTRHRIFTKVGQEWRRTPGGTLSGGSLAFTPSTLQVRLLAAVADNTPVAYLAVDMAGTLVFANAAARQLLDVGEADIGRPFQDLPVSYRPVELRSHIEQVSREARSVRLPDQEYFRLSNTDPLRLTLDLQPLIGSDGQIVATLLAFTDTTHAFALKQELVAAQKSLETSIEELQSANEELETTNEELQSTNEELETTNEELQSTNEELETMNEELRSTNEELELTNEELQRQSEAWREYRTEAESVVRSLNLGLVVLDRNLRVTLWSRWNENAWGLRAEEATGQAFPMLDIGLPVDTLESTIRRVLSGEDALAERTLRAVDRRGRALQCQVQVSPLLQEDRVTRGVVLVVEDVTEAAQADSHERFLGRVLGQSLSGIYFLDPDTLRFRLVNQGAEAKLGAGIAQLRQVSLAELMPGISEGALRKLVAPLLDGEREEVVFATVMRAEGGREHPAEICLQYMADENPPLLLAIAHDVTERQTLARAEEKE